MHLRGQARSGEQGYAMAALLVSLSIMAVMMTVVMPVWKQAARREKESELVFRGQQYARAVGLFQRKYANAFPPSLDVLVEQRFLRRKYKDPITNDDFVPLMQGQAVTNSSQPGTTATTQGAGRIGQPSPTPGTSGTPGQGGAVGGIMGVASKSKDRSIRIYNGRNHYNEWQFVFVPQTLTPGGAPGSGTPGQRGQQGTTGQPGVGGVGGGQRGGQRGGPGGQQPGGGRGGFGPSNPFNPPAPGGTPPPQQPRRPGGN